ncbi:hypothetical protein FJTKL_05138 [Diaporthe vaccinii]|uniref:Uncharacterized protein n=1 Tax=Diaporthe vaccinii TaxID=105482 RepID=A0ABR4FEL7_9PEZI
MPMRASTYDARTESIPIPFSVHAHCLRTGLLLLLLPQSEQTDTGNLDDLESHTGNITLGLALTTETSQEDLVVLVHEVQATVVGDCSHHVSAHHIHMNRVERRKGLFVPKAVTFFPFLINCTRTHFRMAELGCLASTPTFSRTIPLAWEEPPKGEDLKAVPSARFL